MKRIIYSLYRFAIPLCLLICLSCRQLPINIPFYDEYKPRRPYEDAFVVLSSVDDFCEGALVANISIYDDREMILWDYSWREHSRHLTVNEYITLANLIRNSHFQSEFDQFKSYDIFNQFGTGVNLYQLRIEGYGAISIPSRIERPPHLDEVINYVIDLTLLKFKRRYEVLADDYIYGENA